MNVIIPMAQSIDYKKEVRPSWLWVHPNGNLLITEALKGLNLSKVEQVYLAILDEHLQKYDCRFGLEKQLLSNGITRKQLKIVILTKPTTSQPETVATVIEKESITGPIFIKDADNFFNFSISPGNCVAVANINEIRITNPSSKSYVSYDDNGLVANIVEKNVISNLFCCGGYGFLNAEDFLKYYKKIKHKNNIYISHVIYSMLLDEQIFKMEKSSDFIDWGSFEEWSRFRESYVTLFIDFDGTLVENSGEHFPPYWGKTKGLLNNIATINNLYKTGTAHIIITTSRKESYRKQTLQQIEKFGIRYHQIIFNMLHAKRILINDFSDSNPYKSCDAINIPRNSDELSRFIAGYMKR